MAARSVSRSWWNHTKWETSVGATELAQWSDYVHLVGNLRVWVPKAARNYAKTLLTIEDLVGKVTVFGY